MEKDEVEVTAQTFRDDNDSSKVALALTIQSKKAVENAILNEDLGIGNIGAAVHDLREKLELTLEEVAEKSGITASYLSLIENGKRVPKVEALAKIAKALGGVPIYYIMLKAEILNGIKDESKAKLVSSLEFIFDSWITTYLGKKKKNVLNENNTLFSKADSSEVSSLSNKTKEHSPT